MNKILIERISYNIYLKKRNCDKKRRLLISTTLDSMCRMFLLSVIILGATIAVANAVAGDCNLPGTGCECHGQDVTVSNFRVVGSSDCLICTGAEEIPLDVSFTITNGAANPQVCVHLLYYLNQTARGHPTLKGWGMLRAARTPG